MNLEFGFGNTIQWVNVPAENLLGVLLPNSVEEGLSPEAEILRALAEPIGALRLRALVQPGEKIAIITSDITRPLPTHVLMPPLLDELYAAGARREDIALVFALGSHRGHSKDEMRRLAGERAFAEITCVDGDVSDCVHVGTTSRGTPVDIARVVAGADRRICLGNIEYHYFAGYSGGYKAIMPGVSTRDAIQNNHSRMVESAACAGKLQGNPVREDIEEAGAMVGADFLLNVVLDEHKQILRAFAGHPVEAHRAGCAFLDTLYLSSIPARADIVIASQGGAPKDINLYQTQKALDNAKHAVKQGGIIILVGSCKEGLGERVFEEWMLGASTPQSLITRIQREFRLGGHKAAAIAMVLQDADVYLVSDLEASLVEKLFLQPYASTQAALEAAFAKLGPDATVLAMPYAGSTLPRLPE